MNTAGKYNLLPWLLIAVQLCLLVFFAFNRLVDGDEGFYLSAAREVAAGRILYSDFFYPQMPYLPHIFALFAGHGFATLFATRLASVLAALMTTGLFYLLLKKSTSDQITSNVILGLYVFSGLVISWHSVAKTFAWADLFLMGSFYCIAVYIRQPRLWLAAGAGILIALAVNVRLVLMPLVIVFFLPIIIGAGKQWWKLTAAYFLPMAVATVPTLFYLIGDSQRFMFDNLWFHFMRNPGVGFLPSLLQRLSVAAKLMANPQILILLVAVIGSYIYMRKNPDVRKTGGALNSAAGIAGVTALVITIVYFLPNPVHQHYFVQAVPFALIAATGGIEAFMKWARQTSSGSIARIWPLALSGVYLLGLVPYFVIYIGAVRDFDGHSDIGNMKRLCASINETPDDGFLLSELPIVSVLANRPTFPGVEFLGFEYYLPLDTVQMRFYRLVLNRDIKEILDNRRASCYVIINDPPRELAASMSANYQLQGTFDKYRVYRRKS